MEQIIVDVASGTEERVSLTAEAEALAAALRTDDTTERTREEARRALIASVRPDAALRAKVRDGTAPTNAELWQLVRWLVLREAVREIVT